MRDGGGETSVSEGDDVSVPTKEPIDLSDV